jgi:hypothetical protein
MFHVPMFRGSAAQHPQNVLQSFCQRHESLAAEHHVERARSPNTPTCQPEEPVIKEHARNRDIVTPAWPISVKSDSPTRPGSWTWDLAKDDLLCSSPWMERQGRTGRSTVRRMPAPSSG